LNSPYGKTYPACAWTPSAPDSSLSGTLSVRPFSILFEGDHLRLEFPFQSLQLQTDPEDREKIIFGHPNHPGFGVYTYAVEVLGHPDLRKNAEVRRQIQQASYNQNGPSRHTVMVYSVLAAVVLVVLGLWIGSNAIMGFVVARLPSSWETEIGKLDMREVQADFDFVTAPDYTNYLNVVSQRLLAVMPKEMRHCNFQIIDADVVNAFAIPGGHILVGRGLMDAVTTPEELAGVLAHELAHLTQRHGLRKSAEAAGPILALKYLSGQKGSVLTGLAATATFLGQQRFSRKFETEADDIGLEYLVKARINPSGMISFFERLNEIEKHSLKPPAFMLSHPPTPERIADLQARLNGFQKHVSYKPFPKLVRPEPQETSAPSP
jgi:Zn-dependent protease with chaperone function